MRWRPCSCPSSRPDLSYPLLSTKGTPPSLQILQFMQHKHKAERLGGKARSYAVAMVYMDRGKLVLVTSLSQSPLPRAPH